MTRSTFRPKAPSIVMILTFAIFHIASLAGFSQNSSINTTGLPPNIAAGLDIDFPDKGLLIPRIQLVASTSSQPLQAHVAGMIIYNTSTIADVIPGLYYNNGARWVPALPAGNATGDLLYWNGSAWTIVPPGTPGQVLKVSQSNIPEWNGTTSTPLHKVGDDYGGGKIFHVDSRGEHGLIVALTNLGNCQWGCSSILTGANHPAGISNTIKILGSCTTAGIAARLCNLYEGGGYTDWYLPSKEELSLLLSSNVVSMSGDYWSSTENAISSAFLISFPSGQARFEHKTSILFRVRAIRSF